MAVRGFGKGQGEMTQAWLDRGVTAGDPELLDGQILDELLEASAIRAVPGGTVLARAGVGIDRIVVVVDGELELSQDTRSGRRVVGLLHRGGVVGDVTALTAMPMPFDAIATRDSRVVECDLDRLPALLRRSPELSVRWMTSLARRLLAAQRHALALLRRDLTAQVAALLLLEQDDAGETPAVRLSQESIAQLLGASRQSVSRILSGFRARDLVRTGYRSVVLLDHDALAALAGMTVSADGQ